MPINLIEQILIGIASGAYASSTLPKGLKQAETCAECVYGGTNAVVNYCRRPADQICYQQQAKKAINSAILTGE